MLRCGSLFLALTDAIRCRLDRRLWGAKQTCYKRSQSDADDPERPSTASFCWGAQRAVA